MIITRSKVLLNFLKYRENLDLRMARLLSSSSSAEPSVLLSERSNAGIITLNRPKALNAINMEMVKIVNSGLKDFQSRKNLVIIKGSGEKSFCAGGDVRVVVEGPVEYGKEFFRNEYTNNYTIGTYKKPFVAIIDGITMGGGVGLSVHGKYRVATERTMFAMPETAIGLFPDVGGSFFLPKLPGKLGLYLGLTGYRLRGRDVQKAGIATHYVDSTKLEEMEEDLSQCKNDYDVDKTLYKFSSLSKDSSEFVLQSNLKQIDSCFGAETVEGIIENLRCDGSDWAESTLKLLKKMSPTSMKVTQRQLKMGSTMDLAECLRMEFRMAVHHCIKSDFHEGVRALLITKDQNPKWNPAKLEDVTEEHVARFFEPLPDNDELILKTSNSKL